MHGKGENARLVYHHGQLSAEIRYPQAVSCEMRARL